MYKIFFKILFLVLPLCALSQVNYNSITGYRNSQPDTAAKNISQQLATETYGILDREIVPEQYIVGAQDEFTIILPMGASSQNRLSKFRTRVSPDGNLLIDGVGSVHVSGKNLKETYALINEKLGKVFKEFSVSISDIRKFKVTISGPAIKSCIISATAADRVSDIIERAGGLKDSASVRNILLIRDEGSTRKKVDLLKYYLLGDISVNPYLMGGDNIIVPLISANDKISIQGDVPAPNEIEFIEGDSLSDLIRIGLGFFETSALDSVEYVQTNASGIIKKTLDLSTWKNILSSNENPSGNFALNSGDRIYVRSKADRKKTYYAVIRGEVKYPGKYAIEKDVDRISDLLRFAGGFTDDADLKTIEFIRQSEMTRKDIEMERLSKTLPSEMTKSEMRYYQARVKERRGVISIDFEKVITDKNSVDNILLVSGDSVVVAAKKDFVGVQGKVIKPGLVKYQEGYTYIDYINSVGGFADRADEGETTINKASGEQFLASKMKKYIIEPGDNIAVPPKSDVSVLEVVTTVLAIISPIISIIAVLVAMDK